MQLLTSILLGLTALQAHTARAELEVESVAELPGDGDPIAETQTPTLNVRFQPSFPQAESIFGVKLVNDKTTNVLINVANDEPEPVKVIMVGGSLVSLTEPPVIMKNLSIARPNLDIPGGEAETIQYSIRTDLHPAELRLNLAAAVQDSKNVYTVNVYNATVSVVDAPLSIFDPQIIFLYLVLAGAFAGTCYFIYTTWFPTLFPQYAKKGKGGRRTKTSTTGKKSDDPAEQTSVVGDDGAAVATGAKAYDESWIPTQHLQRPEAKRVNSGRTGPRTKSKA